MSIIQTEKDKIMILIAFYGQENRKYAAGIKFPCCLNI